MFLLLFIHWKLATFLAPPGCALRRTEPTERGGVPSGGSQYCHHRSHRVITILIRDFIDDFYKQWAVIGLETHVNSWSHPHHWSWCFNILEKHSLMDGFALANKKPWLITQNDDPRLMMNHWWSIMFDALHQLQMAFPHCLIGWWRGLRLPHHLQIDDDRWI